MALIDDLKSLRSQAEAELAQVKDAAALEAWRSKYLGKRGLLKDYSARIGALPAEEKAAVGRLFSETRAALEATGADREKSLSAGPQVEKDHYDLSVPGELPVVGRRHPIYSTLREIERCFSRLGFTVETGPEIETAHYNFHALNIPPNHPAQEPFDTFYLEGKEKLLRSHTSPVQVHVMERQKPPIRVLVPGKVFRPDAADARHYPIFHQVEGLAIDTDITFADLKGILSLFAKDFFQRDVKMRFRPSYFPFTEPSAEVDCSCIMCDGKGCQVCGQSGWLEILGSGMVHPKVLANVGIDPERWQGFAFGMGVERLCMLKHRIPDIRLFHQNHFRFLGQFG